jgi:hypothetical protein
MKLLIDIDDELKTEVHNHGLSLCPNDKTALVNAIKHGTPLDKIRAEIEQRKQKSGGEPNRELAFSVCLQIVDKYRSEVSK